MAADPSARSSMRLSRMRRHAMGVAGFSALLLACMLLQADRESVRTFGLQLPEICMMKRTTGIPCPGCGLTRCFILMGHADFGGAWRMSPAGALFFVLMVAQIPLQSFQFWQAWRGRGDTIGRWNGHVLVALGGLLIIQWIWRIAVSQLPP